MKAIGAAPSKLPSAKPQARTYLTAGLQIFGSSLMTIAAFGGLLLFAVTPQRDDTTVLVVFSPGTSQKVMVEAVTRAGARLVAFSRVSFAVEVHVDGRQSIDRLKSGALLVARLRGLVGCMRDPSKLVVGSAS